MNRLALLLLALYLTVPGPESSPLHRVLWALGFVALFLLAVSLLARDRRTA